MNLNNFKNPYENKILEDLSQHKFIQKIGFDIKNGKPTSIVSEKTRDKNDGRLKIIKSE